jgi:hypothetical protein
MSEPELTNAWVWPPSPPASANNPWQAECYSGGHYVVYAPTQQAAQDLFLREHPELRGVVRWIFGPPPKPTRPGEKPDVAPAIEHDAISYNALAKRFHPDLCGKRKFDAHTIMSIINELRGAKS